MSGAVIDVTKRSRIRALAARMHRAKVADVLSIDGGAVQVDESLLSDEQRSEATKILESVTAGAASVEDVATASRVAAMIPHYVKPSCSSCHGSGLVRRGSAEDLCICVDRRWQAAIDHQAHLERLRAPGHASGVRVESTRKTTDEERLVKAKEVLARAQAEAAAACADFDAEIATLEADGATYFAERERLDASRAERAALADANERLVNEQAVAVADRQSKVEEIVLQIGQLLEPLFKACSIKPVDEDRALVHAGVDAAFAVAAEVEARSTLRKNAEDVVRLACTDVRGIEQQIAALDADNAPLVAKISRLRTERARIARHHQPKIDRAEKRLRRLIYISGGAALLDAYDAQQQRSEG